MDTLGQCVTAQLPYRQLLLAFENFPHGISIYDESKRLTLSNTHYAELYRLPPELLRSGTSVSEIDAYRVSTGSLKIANCDVALANQLTPHLNQPSKASWTDQFEDGRFVCETRLTLPSGGWVAIHEDVTDREQSRLHLEAKYLAKSEFLATMSHEIRTPMSGMMGVLALLLDTPLSQLQRSLVEPAVESGTLLLKIADEILDDSRVEAGTITTEEVNFNLSKIIENCLSLFSAKASKKGVIVSTKISSIPKWVCGDPTRVHQILSNLLGNAVKFTEHGSVRLSCAHQDLGHGQLEVRIEVRDTGIGISDGVQDRIFSRLKKGDSSTACLYGGAGLGLAISKSLVELMGGRIGFRRSAGIGSTFWFTFRCARAHATASPTNVGSTLPQIDLHPARRVLVAEDNQINQRIVAAMLKKAGHIVDLVGNGIEAIVAVDQRLAYDVVLMDMQMPIMNGLAAAAAIRKLPGAKGRTPIIALTANVMAQHREQCLSCGMNDVLTKPFTLEDLLGTIARWGAEQMPTASLAIEDTNGVVHLKSRAAHPTRRQTRRGTSSTPVEDQADKCLDDLEAALANRDLAAVRRVGPDLRGLAAIYSDFRLSEMARYLEQEDTDMNVVRDLVKHIEDIVADTGVRWKSIA